MVLASKHGVKKLFDADFDGDIDRSDVMILGGLKVPGVTAKLGTPEAQAQFAKIEGWVSKKGVYRGKSLDWGAGGRSLLLKDRLLAEGHTPAQAEDIVRINFFQKRGLNP
ncbi:MAG: hypothetical protein KAJ55_02205 [Anaerolineales bacterium]|nr:hypothetical protein [Anaerolineales bacterium]